MGKILVKELGQSRIVPLKEHTILGRSPKCDILLTLQSVPNLWLELRYLNGHWLWNVLNGDGETVGVGSYTENHWRKFSKKIKFGNVISLELIDDGEPETLIEDQHRQFLPLSRFPTIKQSAKHSFQLGEHTLANGTAFVHDNQIYTLWIPGSTQSTEEQSMLDAQDSVLKIDLDALSATFDFGSRQYTVSGEAARTLAVYAAALIGDTPWLNTEEAYLDWIASGGSSDSPTDRINWERNKILGKLNKQGAFPLVSLFKRRKTGATWSHCLEFSGEINFDPVPFEANKKA